MPKYHMQMFMSFDMETKKELPELNVSGTLDQVNAIIESVDFPNDEGIQNETASVKIERVRSSIDPY